MVTGRVTLHAMAPIAPPILRDGDIGVRPLGEPDVEALVRACADPEIPRWTTVPSPYAEPDARWFRQERGVTGWAAGTTATFAVADPSDTFAGLVDLRIDRLDPAVAEVGYLLHPDARGRGYATAALRAVCAWGFDALALERIVWRAHVGNLASQRVAERAGFVTEGVQRHALPHRGERRDGWVAALLPTDL